MRRSYWWTLVASAVLTVSGAGCTTNAFCFADCEPEDAGTADVKKKDSGPSVIMFNDSSFGTPDAVMPEVDACAPTNGGNEICDGIDNDCNGQVDDGLLDKITSCGTCDN